MLNLPRSVGALIALGSIGILVLIPITASQIAALPTLSLPPLLLSALAALQPLALLIAGALLGATLAPRVGFRSLIAERASRKPAAAGDWDGVLPLVAISVLLGVAINVVDAITQPVWLPTGTAWPAYEEVWSPLTLTFGMLYGGITEEITFRWGLMSLLVWLTSLLAPTRTVRPWAVSLGILLSAGMFAAGHLPVVAAVMPLSAGPVIRTLAFNSLVGIWLGWIFARWHLEAAMLNHAAVHIGFAIYAVGRIALG
jgi:hypothetical protein